MVKVIEEEVRERSGIVSLPGGRSDLPDAIKVAAGRPGTHPHGFHTFSSRKDGSSMNLQIPIAFSDAAARIRDDPIYLD
jgi:hypothetical protein